MPNPSNKTHYRFQAAVFQIIADELALEVEEVTADKRLQEELGADSLDVISIVLEIEQRLELAVDDETKALWFVFINVPLFKELFTINELKLPMRLKEVKNRLDIKDASIFFNLVEKRIFYFIFCKLN